MNRQIRILVVEDEEAIRTGLIDVLVFHGYEADSAATGPAGLEKALTGTFDLVLLDIMLPGRNGYQICADLRAADDWTPILMLTAKDGDLDEAEALDTGADDYLVKPFSFPVLVSRIRALLRRAGNRADVPDTVGDLRIDPAARRVWRGAPRLGR